jgi:hypothetical protein
MDRFTRFIGIGLLVGAFVVAVGAYQRTLAAITPVEVEQELVLPIEIERRQAMEAAAAANGPDAEPPRLLGFVDGYRSGLYTVEYAPLPSPESDSDSSSDSSSDPDFDEVPAVVNAADVVPGTMAPGLYATSFGVENCSYEIRRETTSRRFRPVTERVIGQDYLADGRLLVSFNDVEPDLFSARPGCGVWVPWSPVIEPLEEAVDGDYWVGDLAAGTWSVPDDCLWEKVVAFRGAALVDQ